MVDYGVIHLYDVKYVMWICIFKTCGFDYLMEVLTTPYF